MFPTLDISTPVSNILCNTGDPDVWGRDVGGEDVPHPFKRSSVLHKNANRNMANFVHFKRLMTYLHGHKLQSACYSMPLLFKICTTIFIREGLKFFKICCNLEGKGKIAKKLHSPKKIDLLNSTLCINLIFDFSMFFVVKNYSSD